jgi:hypothetical protein
MNLVHCFPIIVFGGPVFLGVFIFAWSEFRKTVFQTAINGGDMSTGGSAPQEPLISATELRKLEEQIAGMIRHENELLNHRIQWFLTLNGFLFTAVAVYGNQPGRNWFACIMAGVGLLTCLSFGVALSIGRSGFGRLESVWKAFYVRCEGHFNEVGVYGFRASSLQNFAAPWNALPKIMAIGWVAVIALAWWKFSDESPSGSFTPAVAEKQISVDKI